MGVVHRSNCGDAVRLFDLNKAGLMAVWVGITQGARFGSLAETRPAEHDCSFAVVVLRRGRATDVYGIKRPTLKLNLEFGSTMLLRVQHWMWGLHCPASQSETAIFCTCVVSSCQGSFLLTCWEPGPRSRSDQTECSLSSRGCQPISWAPDLTRKSCHPMHAGLSARMLDRETGIPRRTGAPPPHHGCQSRLK